MSVAGGRPLPSILAVFATFLWMLSFRLSHGFKAASFQFIRQQLSLDAISIPKPPTESGPGVTPSSACALPEVVLKRSRQSKAFRNGNPLVFTRAIQSVPCDVRQGDLVLVGVEGESDKRVGSSPSSNRASSVPLGYGVYNPNSLYRVRILCHRFVQPALYRSVKDALGSSLVAVDPDAALALIVRHHIGACLCKRQALDLPSENTNVFRLVNGEGDSLSGLAIDVLGVRPSQSSEGGDVLPYQDAVAVVMSSAAWCQIHRPVIEAAVLQALPGLQTVVWKTTASRLAQDGLPEGSVERSDSSETSPDGGDKDRAVVVRENGVLFQTFPFANGQKTGVYCDQRENRWNLAQLCRDKRVLDLCCYHGGFALHALIHGPAASATAVDSSQDAIAVCLENARLNGCHDKLECVAADITSFLQKSHGKREYDVVILDPPKLAPTAASLDKARRKYHGLNRDAIKVVAAQGGLLLTCTCSAAMTQKDGGQYFLEMVSGAALAAGRDVTLLRVSGAASCHTQAPTAWPAGSYLTAALFYVHPT